MKVVALGEPLIQLNSVTPGPLRYVGLFEKHVAGSEANFCVAASRFGCHTSLIARVGSDEFGHNIVEWLRGKGVDTSHVKFDQARPTGVYFVQRGFTVPYKSKLVYYRAGGAGSSLSAEDVDEQLITQADCVHSTGITVALSQTARQAVEKAFSLAKRRTFDTNIRPVLWKSMDEARSVVRRFVEGVEVLVTDADDARIIFGTGSPEEAFREARKLSVGVMVFKLGPKGVSVYTEEGKLTHPGYTVPVEDPTGAGDALAGTFVSLHIQGRPFEEALRYAVVSASLVVEVRGDQENIPDASEARAFLKEMGD